MNHIYFPHFLKVRRAGVAFFAGCLWLRVLQELPSRYQQELPSLQVSAGGRSGSKFTTMVGGRPLVLTGCLLKTAVSCHTGQFTGQLIAGQPASIRACECPRWKAQSFCDLTWDVTPITFARLFSLEANH